MFNQYMIDITIKKKYSTNFSFVFRTYNQMFDFIYYGYN